MRRFQTKQIRPHKMFNAEKINQLNCQRLTHVTPELARKVLQILEIANREGFDLLVSQGFRSVAEQNKLYAQGRTTRGKIVTNARGGQSNHNFGTAVDFCFIVGGQPSWDERLYKNIGRWARIVGLKWGGNWRSFKDLPHVEL